MKKILFTLCISCCSIAYSQNLNFADSQFKALILNSNSSNEIAKNLNGNFIAIDANGDGEIQISEAQEVKILTIKLPAFNSNLVPDSISDAIQFTNVEELYIYHANSAILNYVDNNKIKKVKYVHNAFAMPHTIAYSFNNCSALQVLNDVITSPTSSQFGPYITPQTLTVKNCSQIVGNVNVEGVLENLIIENSPIINLEINTGVEFHKLSVPSMNSLLSIKFTSGFNFNSAYQGTELIANNCTNLQEITTAGDYYNNSMVYISSINVNGCSNLKKIKGLNYQNIDFSGAGLINLEELDCAFYNRYGYTGSYGGTVTLGSVNSINLTGLPKLNKLWAYNQPISSDINFTVCPLLGEIDVVNSICFMTGVDVSNLAHLHTLKAFRGAPNDGALPVNLQQVNAQNCTELVNLKISGNYDLKNLNVQNCSSLQSLKLGMNLPGNSTYDSFPELTTLNVEQCTSLEELGVSYTKISSLDIDDCVALKSLAIKSNALLPQVDMFNNINLLDVIFENMPLLTQANTSNNINLSSFDLINCPLVTALNFSTAPNLNTLNLWNIPNLTSVNIRNNSIEQFYEFYNYNSNLSVCVDNAQLVEMQNTYPDINFNTNCDSVLNTAVASIDKKDIQFFPNPVKDFIQIKSSDNIKSIQLFDMQGRIIINQNYNQNLIKLDLSANVNGNYLIKIKTDKTEFTKKIIKNQ